MRHIGLSKRLIWGYLPRPFITLQLMTPILTTLLKRAHLHTYINMQYPALMEAIDRYIYTTTIPTDIYIHMYIIYIYRIRRQTAELFIDDKSFRAKYLHLHLRGVFSFQDGQVENFV